MMQLAYEAHAFLPAEALLDQFPFPLTHDAAVV